MYKERNLVRIDYKFVQKFFCFCLCFIDSFSAKLEPMTGKTADLCLMLPQWLIPRGIKTNVSKLIWESVGGKKVWLREWTPCFPLCSSFLDDWYQRILNDSQWTMQAFSPSYDLLHPSRSSFLFFFVFLCVAGRAY
jgi:hypothetical protein